ncbi:bacteriohemerythrin [Roseospira navarrensis]|uniref:Bacteriohemerythrin n=1 Tax=Roseospira navarrensis TaxID=140058 RepID=A0A7X2D2R6_9PROT|nr:bacteriohemerythrin [Roseospira navarrensis]MQX36549.1 bacteriohemerythrin [Roseospira navarrensis]
MAYLNWTSDLETGIEVVDRDHKMLVDLLNQAHDCMGAEEEPATLGSVLNALIDYTAFHFAREERLMQAANYRDVDAHRDMHAALTTRVREIRTRYASEPTTVSAREVMEFLRRWLIDHILKQDFRYRADVMAAPDAVKAVDAVSLASPAGAPPARGSQEPTAKPDPVASDPTLGPPGIEVPFRTLSALVVDDNPNFRIILRTILKGLGCPAITLVEDASQGLAALDAGEPPGLMLVDWRMHGMDGLEFVRRARAKGVDAPVVMISGYSEPGFEDTAHAAGVDTFLEKPITARGLTLAVAAAIAARQATPASE